MGRAKKQRTVDYFQHQGEEEIAKRVSDLQAKWAEKEKVEFNKEKQDEVTNTG